MLGATTNSSRAATGGSSDAQDASHKRRKTDPSSSRAKKAYPIIEVREENGPASAPLLNRAVIVCLRSEASTGDVLRRTLEEHVPDFHYVDEDVSSLTTGSGTSLGADFLDEPFRSIAHVLEAGGWRLVAVIRRRSGDAFSPLPDRLVRGVFDRVGEAFSLRACEKSCKRFRKILSDDEAWKGCRGADGERGGSYCEKAFISSVCEEIRKEQRLTRSIILSVLSPESIGRIVNKRDFVWAAVDLSDLCGDMYNYHVRGDALGYLLEIIENYMVGKLRMLSNIFPRIETMRGCYPEVTKHWVEFFHSSHPAGRHHIVRCRDWEACLAAVKSEVDESKRFKLARRLAYKGGLVKITDEVLKELFLLMAFLLRKPLIYLHHINIEKKLLQYESEESIDLWNDIPPILNEPNEACPSWNHVIVPGLIEDAASEIGLSCYGSDWVLSEGQTLDEAIAEAKARYMVKGEYDRDTDDDSASLGSNDSEFKSLSDLSEDGDISEYYDEDCPDEGFDDESLSDSSEDGDISENDDEDCPDEGFDDE